MRISELSAKTQVSVDRLRRYETGQLTSEEMILAIRQRVAEVDQAIAAQKALRNMLLNHIDWFQSKPRKTR